MRIDTNLLKRERNKRAWSQEHLAQVAGLGLRTVQRIESSGSASNESIASIATAFAMNVAAFVEDAPRHGAAYDIVRTLGGSLPDVSGVRRCSRRIRRCSSSRTITCHTPRFSCGFAASGRLR